MRLLCVARHEFLSGHLCQYFAAAGVESHPAVGLDDAIRRVADVQPSAVVCDYDLLTSSTLEPWESDPRLAKLPLIAVSLTRRPEDVAVQDGGPVAGFLYLPTLDRADALRLIAAACRESRIVPPAPLPWPGARPAQYR